MTLYNTVNPTRFTRLAINDIRVGGRSLLIALGATVGLLLVTNASSVASSERWYFHIVFFPLTLMLGGHIATSLCFREMHNPKRGYMYLTMPGSLLEKFAVKLLLTSIGWAILAVVVYWIFSVLAAGLTSLLLGMAHPVFDPFHRSVWWFVRLYIVTQSVTLFGAVYFRKLHLVKTILSITALAIVLALLAGGLARLVFTDYFRGGWLSFDDSAFNFADGQRLEAFYSKVLDVIVFVFWWVIAPILWVAAFLRLRDTEV